MTKKVRALQKKRVEAVGILGGDSGGSFGGGRLLAVRVESELGCLLREAASLERSKKEMTEAS